MSGISKHTSEPVYAVVGDTYIFKLTGEQTGGQCALFEFRVPPGGGPPPHVHRREDELFHVLEGELAFYVAGERRSVRAGECVFAPRGIAHQFRNESAEPVRALCTAMPAGIERFFVEVGRRLDHADVTVPPVSLEEIDRVLAMAPTFGIEILPHT